MIHAKYEGAVTRGDSCRCSGDDEPGSVRIGGTDFLTEIEKWQGAEGQAAINGNVIGHGRFDIEIGWGYSSWTGMECDNLVVGGVSVMRELENLEGETVSLELTAELSDSVLD